jgi:hypothetical protein
MIPGLLSPLVMVRCRQSRTALALRTSRASSENEVHDNVNVLLSSPGAAIAVLGSKQQTGWLTKKLLDILTNCKAVHENMDSRLGGT